MSAPELSDDSSYDDLRRTIMVSRYLDRTASISIDAACRLTFLLTGQRLTASDLVDIDENELESMRVPSGEGVVLDPKTDAQYVAKLPLDEVGEQLRHLIESLNDDDEVDADGDEAVATKE